MTPETPVRLDVAFPSSGDECRAWLFLPKAERPPLVILGHGLGGTREDGLEPFARRFAEAGIAALVFTYRHFGDSGGATPPALDIEHQLGDWAAALAYARTLDGIDTERIALWGSSFGGGHVIEAAARDGGVAAVVSQCPFTDGLAAVRAANPRSLARGSVLALRDELTRVRRQAAGADPARRPARIGGADDLPGLRGRLHRAAPPGQPSSRTASPPGSSTASGCTARAARPAR